MSDPLGLLDEEDPLGLMAEPSKPAPKTWGEAGKQAMGSAPESMGKYLLDTFVNPFYNVKQGKFALPETTKNLSTMSLLFGSPLGQIPHPAILKKKQEIYNGLDKYARERYGTIENLKNTIATDPAGVMGDVASILTSGSMIAGATNLPKTARILSKMGTMAEPLTAAMLPAKGALKAIAKTGLPEKAYISAVKPQFTKKKGVERTLQESKVGLEQGIMPNEAGLEKLKGRIAQIESTVGEAIESAGGNAKQLASQDILKYVPDILDEYAKKSIVPSESIDIIKSATDKFISEHGDFVGLEHALQLKKGLYEDLKGKYGVQTTAPRELVDTYKSIARGLKDSIYDAVLESHPELRLLGQEESHLLGLKGAIEQGAQRIAKRDIMGIGLPLKTGVAASIGKMTGSAMAGTLVGITAGVMDTPMVKARLAIALNKSRRIKLINEAKAKRRLAIRGASILNETQENN